jgi:phospholipase C
MTTHLTRRRLIEATSSVALAALAKPAIIKKAVAQEARPNAFDRIEHWVLVMCENRSFDSLLGYLPHLDPADGLIGRDVSLRYPGGTVKVRAATDFRAPIPDPGEAFANNNVQIYGSYRPASNAGKSAFPIFPDFMEAPYNAPLPGQPATMDGFALDYYWNYRWEKGQEPSAEDMDQIGQMFTPQTAPVINGLARDFAVFSNWHCEAPTCTFPNRAFYHAGTSMGMIDNDWTYDRALQFTVPSLFDRLTERGVDWKVYFAPSQIVPCAAICLGGLHKIDMWKAHSAHQDAFFADALLGRLPRYSWLEPNVLFGPFNDYHPPYDIRPAEYFLAAVYNAVRQSPQWEKTALVVFFDESGGCYDHVPPPAAPIPDAFVGQQGFAFDRFGPRIPAIVVSAWTEPGTVVRDLFHSCALTRSIRESLDLGPAFTARDAGAPLISPAFNRSSPRQDAPWHVEPPSLADAFPNLAAAPGDMPSTGMFFKRWEAQGRDRLSGIGAGVLRHVARTLGEDISTIPAKVEDAKLWLAARWRA